MLYCYPHLHSLLPQGHSVAGGPDPPESQHRVPARRVRLGHPLELGHGARHVRAEPGGVKPVEAEAAALCEDAECRRERAHEVIIPSYRPVSIIPNTTHPLIQYKTNLFLLHYVLMCSVHQ